MIFFTVCFDFENDKFVVYSTDGLYRGNTVKLLTSSKRNDLEKTIDYDFKLKLWFKLLF